MLCLLNNACMNYIRSHHSGLQPTQHVVQAKCHVSFYKSHTYICACTAFQGPLRFMLCSIVGVLVWCCGSETVGQKSQSMSNNGRINMQCIEGQL